MDEIDLIRDQIHDEQKAKDAHIASLLAQQAELQERHEEAIAEINQKDRQIAQLNEFIDGLLKKDGTRKRTSKEQWLDAVSKGFLENRIEAMAKLLDKAPHVINCDASEFHGEQICETNCIRCQWEELKKK